MAKSSKLLTEYRKQRKRVLNYISRARKKGYTFDIEIPSIPKKPTRKDINFFAKITPESLRKKGYYASEETGEVISAEQAFKQKRSEAARKAAQTRKRVDADTYYDYWNEPLDGDEFVVDRFTSVFDEVREPSDTKRYYRRKPDAVIASQQKSLIVLDKIDEVINKYGSDELVKIITENYDVIENAIDHLVYGYDLNEINSGFYPIIRILNGGAITLADAKKMGEIEDTDFPVY